VLITRHFVALHIPKTGGNFVKRLCEVNLPPDWIVEHDLALHAPVRALSEEQAALPIFAVVRDPWDWYVSWWSFSLQHERPPGPPRGGDLHAMPRGRVWTDLFGDSTPTFRECVEKACAEEPDVYTRYWLNIIGGLRNDAIDVGRFESLRGDFADFLQRHEIPVGDDFIELVRNWAPRNESTHDHYSDYYDDDLRELVTQRTKELADEYGYGYVDAQAASADASG